eukprot:scaffold1073_cov383-Prasinococcus_capsulatus_cf.AAC.8
MNERFVNVTNCYTPTPAPAPVPAPTPPPLVVPAPAPAPMMAQPTYPMPLPLPALPMPAPMPSVTTSMPPPQTNDGAPPTPASPTSPPQPGTPVPGSPGNPSPDNLPPPPPPPPPLLPPTVNEIPAGLPLPQPLPNPAPAPFVVPPTPDVNPPQILLLQDNTASNTYVAMPTRVALATLDDLTMAVQCGVWQDPGALAVDILPDGAQQDLTDTIMVVYSALVTGTFGVLNTAQVGQQVVEYSVVDDAGRSSPDSLGPPSSQSRRRLIACSLMCG